MGWRCWSVVVTVDRSKWGWTASCDHALQLIDRRADTGVVTVAQRGVAMRRLPGGTSTRETKWAGGLRHAWGADRSHRRDGRRPSTAPPYADHHDRSAMRLSAGRVEVATPASGVLNGRRVVWAAGWAAPSSAHRQYNRGDVIQHPHKDRGVVLLF